MKQKHKKAELGYTVPEDYFKESKKRMTVNTLLKVRPLKKKIQMS